MALNATPPAVEIARASGSTADEAHRGVLDQRREAVRLGRQAAGSCFAQQRDGDGRETRGAAKERRLRVAGASSPEPLFELDGGEIGVEVDVQDRRAVLVDVVA